MITRADVERSATASGADLACLLANAVGCLDDLTDAPSHGFDDQRLLHRRLGTEVSLVLGVSPWVADREVDLAWT